MGFFKDIFLHLKNKNREALLADELVSVPEPELVSSAETVPGPAAPPAFPADSESVANQEPEASSEPEADREPEASPNQPVIHPAAWQVADCIDTEYASPALSSQGFAEALQMNHTYLCRIFRASYQMSINEYINQTRIRHSLAYLETTDLPVEEIARRVGFENTKYFFVLFKNLMGQTPRQYRLSASRRI